MIARATLGITVSFGLAVVASGCVALPSPDSPLIQDKLKLISAGHTGCQPDQNIITNVQHSLNGDGQWNATCKDKIYLCTTAGTATGAQPYSCAIAVP